MNAAMTGIGTALLGIVVCAVGGFLGGAQRTSNDPELVLAAYEGIKAIGLFLVIVGAIQVARVRR